MLHHFVARRFLGALEQCRTGSITVTDPEGKRHTFTGDKPGATAEMIIQDPKAITFMAFKGDTGLAEGFRDELWTTPDPAALCLYGIQNERELSGYIHAGLFAQACAFVNTLLTRNSRAGSKKNIRAHYDVGNAFYQLWLDPGMTYSSAIFARKDEDLMDAQNRKYDRILERLGPQGGRTAEIGCGWGAFAERSVQRRDYDLTCLTLSREQHAYAQARLGEAAKVVLQDYRELQGSFDRIVSIEMFEAVGERYWPVYFEKVQSLMKKDGKAMIQTITVREEEFERYRKGGDAIRSFIFPGGMLPSRERFESAARTAGLAVTDRFEFGHDYALTLRRWLESFDRRLADVRALGYDEGFIRMWRFYLSLCIAGFESGKTNVMQTELVHA